MLVMFWGVFIAVWPLGLAELLSGFRSKVAPHKPSGRVLRTDAPNCVRAVLEPSTQWQPSCVYLYQQTDGEQRYVVPLSSEEHGEETVGIGLCAGKVEEAVSGLQKGYLYHGPGCEMDEAGVCKLLGGDKGTRLVGFVDVESTIDAIRFQTLTPTCCREGMMVYCKIGEEQVYYQITQGTTKEEALESNRHGFQVATASQLGPLDSSRGFTKYAWLPGMNAQVFAVSDDFGAKDSLVQDGDFAYGKIPGTSLTIGGQFSEMTEYHTALLGVTGSGKTELAFDLIRHAASSSTKVICIDLTQRYAERLADLTPKNLSLSRENTEELGEKLFDVDTGTYGAPDEKRALGELSDTLRANVQGEVSAFIEGKGDENRVGIITLEEISNTKATIHVTELFLTSILNYARDNTAKCPKILVVLEEAHTVIPETATMGLGDFASKGVVSRIAQIALQGRKYGVGLLVIAQRTATVSKTVLTQCNTIVSFTCYDNTSLAFLGNVFGDRHTSLIPDLPFLHAVVFGKGVRSERPIVVEIAYDKGKAEATTA